MVDLSAGASGDALTVLAEVEDIEAKAELARETAQTGLNVSKCQG